MGEEEAGNGNGGDGGNAGAADPGSQEGGTGAGVSHGGTAGAEGQPQMIPAEALPEQLRGRQPSEIKLILDHTVAAVQRAADENRRLKEELDTSRSRGISTPTGTGGEEKPTKPLEELILENPEEAIDQVIQKRYGRRLAELDSNVGEAVYDSLRNREPGFAEYEDEVREALRRGNLPAKRDHIVGAFLMAAGRKALEEKRQKNDPGKATASAGGSRTRDEKPEKQDKLTDLDREVAREMRMSEEKYAGAKKKAASGSFDIKVPDGKPKGAKNA